MELNTDYNERLNNDKHINNLTPIMSGDIAVCNIAVKIESIDSLDNTMVKTENKPDLDIVNTKMLPQHTFDVIKIEYNDVVKHDRFDDKETIDCNLKSQSTNKDLFADGVTVKIAEEMIIPEECTNIEMLCRSAATDVAVSRVKVEHCGVMNEDGAGDSTVECRVLSAGSVRSTVDIPPVAETPATGVQQVRAERRPRADNGGLPCEVCHKTFRQNYELVNHMRSHTGEKPFTCKVCDKTFAYKRNLTDHLKIHSGEKLFSCEVCQKKFRKQNILTRHMKTHSGQKPFACEVCNKTFADKRSLSPHMKSHTREKPFSCEICHKSFSYKRTLTDHMRTHSGEKPFSCEVCDESFSYKKSLTDHMWTHSAKKPYSCEVCQKRFAYKRSLTDHITTHSEDDRQTFDSENT